MQPIPLVSGWNVLPFASFLRGIGAPVDRWLADAKIVPDLLAEPDRPVPLAHLQDFVEHAARAEGAESIGIDVGRHSAAECLGAFGARLACCATLYERVQAACRMVSLSNNCESMWMQQDGPNVRFHARIEGASEPCRRHADDFTLMLILEAVGRAAPPGMGPRAIYLPDSRSKRFARDELFQDVQMVYGAPHVTVVFPACLLSRALEPCRDELGRALGAPVVLPDGYSIPTDFVASLEATITSLLPIGCPSVGDLAEIAGTTPRTLQRRLATCDTSLRRVFDRARFRMASGYLRDTCASITDIAFRLGYSDSTAFARAFHRIAGVPPSAYRTQHCDTG